MGRQPLGAPLPTRVAETTWSILRLQEQVGSAPVCCILWLS